MRFDSYQENTLRFESEKCVGCTACLTVCPHAVFSHGERQIVLSARERCMECGACQMNCPTGALSVNSGVGCATALINGALTGNESCGCGGDDCENSCC
jgi:NAD-dependent dihydropyrimidine dehydrogenase PreA subunit